MKLRRPMTEEDRLKADTIRLAELVGWRVFSIRRSDRAKVQGHTGKGWPDLAMAKGGELLAVELKSATGTLTPEQRAWQQRLHAVPGVRFFVWRPQHWKDGTIERVLKGMQ